MRKLVLLKIKELLDFILSLISLFAILLAIPLLIIGIMISYYLIFEKRLPTKQDFTGLGETVVEPYSGLPWNIQSGSGEER